MWPGSLTQGLHLLMPFVLTRSLIFFCFSPFQFDSPMPDENTKPQEYCHRSTDRTLLDNTVLVQTSVEPSSRQPTAPSSVRQLVTIASHRGTTPPSKENEINDMQTIRTSLLQRDVSHKATEIIMHSWEDASLKQYKPYLQTWIQLCSEWKINPYDPPLTRVLDFLTSLFERGLKYGAINTAKSAISAITEPKHGLTLGSQPLISRFMKGVFRSRPLIPRSYLGCSSCLISSRLFCSSKPVGP